MKSPGTPGFWYQWLNW